MNRFFTLLRRPARMIAMISVCAYAFFTILAVFGNLAGGASFGQVLGTLSFFVMLIGLAGGYVFACIKRKDDACRFLGFLLLGYIVGRNVMGLVAGFYDSGSGAYNVYLVFDFLAAICASGALVLELLKLFLEKFKENKIVFIIEVCLVGAYAFFSLIGIFCLIGAEAGWGSPWTNYMSNIASILLLPAILIAFVLLFVPEGKTPLDAEPAKAEEAPAEENHEEDAPAEENHEEEAPAQEAKEGKVNLQKGE